MMKYTIYEIEVSKINYIDYAGPMKKFTGELSSGILKNLLSDIRDGLNAEYEEKVRGEMMSSILPSNYIDAMRVIKSSGNKPMAFTIYKNLRAELRYPKDINEGFVEMKNLSSFIENSVLIMDVNAIEKDGNVTSLDVSSINADSSYNNIKIDIMDLNIEYQSAILGFTKYGDIYILGYDVSKDEKSIFISYNPSDKITYLESDKLEFFLNNPVDSNPVNVVNRIQSSNMRDFSHYIRFIENTILESGINSIYTQALIPHKIKDGLTVNRQYGNEKRFLWFHNIFKFETMLRCIDIIFNLEKCHSSVRVTPYRKLFNDMDRYISVYRNGKRKSTKKDMQPFKYNSHNDHDWKAETFEYTEGLTPVKKIISRRNNDMVVLLIFLYDERILPDSIESIIRKNIKSFRKEDFVIKA